MPPREGTVINKIGSTHDQINNAHSWPRLWKTTGKWRKRTDDNQESPWCTKRRPTWPGNEPQNQEPHWTVKKRHLELLSDVGLSVIQEVNSTRVNQLRKWHQRKTRLGFESQTPQQSNTRSEPPTSKDISKISYVCSNIHKPMVKITNFKLLLTFKIQNTNWF